MIQLGDRAKDTVTGFEGIAVCKSEWLYGCVRFTIQPEKLDKEGKVKESATFDEPQLKLLKKAAVAGQIPKEAPRTYGPRDDAAATRRQ